MAPPRAPKVAIKEPGVADGSLQRAGHGAWKMAMTKRPDRTIVIDAHEHLSYLEPAAEASALCIVHRFTIARGRDRASPSGWLGRMGARVQKSGCDNCGNSTVAQPMGVHFSAIDYAGTGGKGGEGANPSRSARRQICEARSRRRMARQPKLAGQHSRPSPSGLRRAAFTRFASEGWWAMTGSNRRPVPCKGNALPLS
jgi:hypothetical protein